MSVSDPLPDRLKICFRIAFVAIPLLAGIGIARSHHTGLVLDHYLNGRAGTCNLTQSFRSEVLSNRQIETAEELRGASEVERVDSGFALWKTPMGSYWIPATSKDAVLYDLAEQKRKIYGEGETGVHPGDIVLDAGANVGVFTRTALAAGAKQVIAIEPAPENVECLRRNFAKEIADGRVVVYPKGVWNQDDKLRLSVDPENSARDSFVRAIRNARFLEVPLTTIDKLVAELDLPRVDFIKMDIEGAEQQALAGARQTIVRHHPRMALCVYHVEGDDIAVPKIVLAMQPGYRRAMTCLCTADRIQPEVAFFY